LDLDISNRKFVGLLFAGNDNVTIICKVKHIIELGYRPYNVETYEPNEGDKLIKSGRNCVGEGSVIDNSATVVVNYLDNEAVFEDVIITTAMSSPGDSGSAVWAV
jgi:hypothetical protein